MAKALKVVGKIASVAAVVLAFIPGGQPFAAAASAISGVANAGAALLHQPEPQGGAVSKVIIDTSAPTPYVIGRTMTGGVLVHDAGYGARYKKIDNPNRSMVFVYSDAGPVEQIEGLYTDGGFAVSEGAVSGYYSGNMHYDKQLGSRPEATALSGNQGAIPRWGSAYKLSAKAAAVVTMRWDKDMKKFSAGVPELTAIVRGVKVYDPRLDSTYPGGSGSCRINDETTFVYSENPSLHALTYIYGRYEGDTKFFGVGKSINSVDVPAFVEWANVCDTNNWKAGGIIFEPADRWNNLKLIMQAGSARPVHSNGILSVSFDSPKVAVETFTEDDLANGEVIIPSTQSYRDRINGIIPRYRSAAHNWEYVPGTAVSIAAYVTEDGEDKRKERQYTLCQNETQAAQLAGYEIVNSRELKGVTLPLKTKALAYGPGEAVILDMPNLGLSGTFIIQTRRFDPLTAITEVTLMSESAGKHPFALGATTTPPEAPSLVFGEDIDNVAWAARGGASVLENLIATSWPRDIIITANGAGEIIISDHSRVYPDENVAILGDTLTGNALDTLFSIYYDDTNRDGGAVTYVVTTEHDTAQTSEANDGRHFVGYITTPAMAGDPDTTGTTASPPTLVPSTVPNALALAGYTGVDIAADIAALETAQDDLDAALLTANNAITQGLSDAETARDTLSAALDGVFSALPVANRDLPFNADQTEWTENAREADPSFIEPNPSADLTYVTDAEGQRLVSDGLERQLYTRKTLPFYQSQTRVYKISGEFKVEQQATVGGNNLLVLLYGLDASFQDAGTGGAVVSANVTITENPDPVTGWTGFSVTYAAGETLPTGVDLYTGIDPQFEKANTHHIRISFQTNFNNGNGRMAVRGFNVVDITDAYNAEADASALVVAEEAARISGDGALATTISALTSRVGDTESDIVTIQSTKADLSALTTEAQRIDALTSRTDTTEADISTLQTTKADQSALTAEATRIDNLSARTDTTESDITSLQTSKADEADLLATSTQLTVIQSNIKTDAQNLPFNADKTHWDNNNREEDPSFVSSSPFPADITFVDDPVGGNQVIMDGFERTLFTRPCMEYDQATPRVYDIAGEFKVERPSTVGGADRLFFLCYLLDANFSDAHPAGNTVAASFVVDNNPDPVTGWTSFSFKLAASDVPVDGADRYFGADPDFTLENSHKVRVSFQLNFNNGDGRMVARNFRIKEITESLRNEAVITQEATTRATEDTALANLISSLTSRTDTTESDIVSLQSTKADQSALTTEANRITALTSRVTTAEGDIDNAESNITSLDTTKANATDLTTEANRITALDSRVTQAETDIANIGEFDPTAIENSITVVESDITSLQNTKADASALATEASRIDNLTSSVTTITTDVDGLETDVSTVQSDITQEATTRANEDSALASLISNLTSTVGDNTADISSNTTAVASANGSIAQLQTDLSTTNSNVSINAVAISDHDTLFGAGLALRAVAGNASAGLELYSLADPNGSSSTARITGDRILLDGSVEANKLNVNQLSAISADIGVMRTATTGQRLEIRNDKILVYDSSNVLRVKIGNLA